MNQENLKKLACATFATAFVSLLQSSILALVIFKKGFRTPYSRLIFAISVSDILQCIGLILGPFTIPVSTNQGFWAFGNKASCSFSGSLFTFGFAWSPMYAMALSIYYFFKLHKNMTDLKFAICVEKYLHFLFIAFMLICQTIALANDAINSNVIGTFCLYSATPVGCRQAPHIFGECDDNKDLITNLNLTVIISVPFVCLTCIVSILSFLLYKIAARERIFSSLPLTHRQSNEKRQAMHIKKRDRLSWLKISSTGGSINKNGKEYKTGLNQPCLKETNIVADRVHSQQLQEALDVAESSSTQTSHKKNIMKIEQNSASDGALVMNTYVKKESEIRALRTKRPKGSTGSQNKVSSSTEQSQKMARMYRKEMFVQVLLYSCQFIFTNILFSVMNILLVIGKPPPFAFLFASQTLQPLSGVLNIFIFSRPSVCVVRARFPDMSWSRAFWMVFRNGGEAPKQEISIAIRDSSSQAMSSVQFGVANANNLVSSAGGILSFDKNESSCAQFYQIDYKNKLEEIQVALRSNNGCEGKEDIQSTTNVPQIEDEERKSIPDVTSTLLAKGYDSEGLTCKSSPLEDIVRKPELNHRFKEDQRSTSEFATSYTNDDNIHELMQTSSMNPYAESENNLASVKAVQDEVVFVESYSQNIEESFSAYDMSYLSNISDEDEEKLRSFGSD